MATMYRLEMRRTDGQPLTEAPERLGDYPTQAEANSLRDRIERDNPTMFGDGGQFRLGVKAV